MIPLNVTYSLLTTIYIHCFSAPCMMKASKCIFVWSEVLNDGLAYVSDCDFVSFVLLLVGNRL